MRRTKTPVLVHIPKTGGCAVSAALGIRPPGHHVYGSPKWWAKARRVSGQIHPFAVVRDPYTRAQSLFAFLQGLKNRTDVSPAWKAGTQGVVSELIQRMELNDFWEHVDLGFLSARYPFVMPQSAYFRATEPVEVLHMESLAAEFEAM